MDSQLYEDALLVIQNNFKEKICFQNIIWFLSQSFFLPKLKFPEKMHFKR